MSKNKGLAVKAQRKKNIAALENHYFSSISFHHPENHSPFFKEKQNQKAIHQHSHKQHKTQHF